MKKIYIIKETCPLWDDGSGKDYERILPYVFLDKETSDKCKTDLEMIACETYNCCEYEIEEINLIVECPHTRDFSHELGHAQGLLHMLNKKVK